MEEINSSSTIFKDIMIFVQLELLDWDRHFDIRPAFLLYIEYAIGRVWFPNNNLSLEWDSRMKLRVTK